MARAFTLVAEAPGAFHRGLRQGEQQMRATVQAAGAVWLRTPTERERAALAEACRDQPAGQIVTVAPGRAGRDNEQGENDDAIRAD